MGLRDWSDNSSFCHAVIYYPPKHVESVRLTANWRYMNILRNDAVKFSTISLLRNCVDVPPLWQNDTKLLSTQSTKLLSTQLILVDCHFKERASHSHRTLQTEGYIKDSISLSFWLRITAFRKMAVLPLSVKVWYMICLNPWMKMTLSPSGQENILRKANASFSSQINLRTADIRHVFLVKYRAA